MNWTLLKLRIVAMVFMLIISVTACSAQNVSKDLAFGYCMIAMILPLILVDGIFYLKTKIYKLGICWIIAAVGLYTGMTGILFAPWSGNIGLFFAFSFTIGLVALLISVRFEKSYEEK